MFCQNCGEKLERENQRYCQNCGSEIIEISEAPKTTIDMNQERFEPKTIPVPQYSTKFRKKETSGPYSKRCLGFGIVALIIGVISFYVGGFFAFDIIYRPYHTWSRSVFIGLSIVHVIGIIFGIISRVNSGKVKALEPESSILKKGTALGTIGLIINSLLMVLAMAFINPNIQWVG